MIEYLIMQKQETQPNLLIILTDQQSRLMMNGAGNRHLQTPAMDSLAARGVRYDRCYCTNPVCIPSRFSLFTGRMPSEIGLRTNGPLQAPEGMRERLETEGIGWRLREAGYETFYGGKVHLPIQLNVQRMGFDYVCADERMELAEATSALIRGRADASLPFCLVASFINPHDICYMAIREYATSNQDRLLLEKGVRELAALDAALQRPAGMGEAEFFRTVCPPLPPNFEPQVDEPEALLEMLHRRPFRWRAREEATEAWWRLHRWAYHRLTEEVDEEIGVVLEGLRASGLEEETAVIFTSDHGDHSGAHRLEHKSTGYEEAAGVPLIVAGPGVKNTGRIDREHLVSNGLDLIPTLCDYAGIAAPEGREGCSFRPGSETGGLARRQFVPVESDVCRMIVTKRYKYLRYDEGESAEQLHDLETDPWEMRNAARDPEQHEALNLHRGLFAERFGQENGAPARA